MPGQGGWVADGTQPMFLSSRCFSLSLSLLPPPHPLPLSFSKINKHIVGQVFLKIGPPFTEPQVKPTDWEKQPG